MLEALLLVAIALTLGAFFACRLLWQKYGPSRPFLAGFLCFAACITPFLIVVLGFGIDPFAPYFGILFLAPTYGPALVGVSFLLFATAKGLPGATKGLTQLLKAVRYDHPDRER